MSVRGPPRRRPLGSLASPGGVADYSDADLEGPLVALSRHLRRRNATFALDDQTMRAWEESAAEALRGGGDPAEKQLAMNLAHLVQKAPLPQNDRMRNLVFSDESHAVEHFVALLQRARLHHHVGGLLERLDAWERHEAPVWDVIEQIESLRARHVFHARQPGLSGRTIPGGAAPDRVAQRSALRILFICQSERDPFFLP